MSNKSNTNVSGGKSKKKGLNFVDFLLILIALSIVVGAVYLFSPISILRKLTSKVEGTLDYTVEIQNVDVNFIDKIKENDVVIDSVTKNTIGTVTAVDHNSKYSVLSYQADGGDNTQYNGIMLEYPDKYNIKVTVSVSAEYIEGQGYSANNCRIAVGEKMNLRFSDFVCEGYCIYVTPVEDFK